MDKNNKTRIPLNRKTIDEMDTDTKKEVPIKTDKRNFEEENPFSGFDVEDINTSPLDDNILDDFETVENPFSDNKKDFNTDYSENPFDAIHQTNGKDFDDIETIIDTPPIQDTPNVDLVIDPNMPYFFVFGNSTAGKSAMLSGLLYYMQTAGIGQLRSLGLQDQEHHSKGLFVLQEMRKKVKRGEFILGTKALDPTQFVFPAEINLEFQLNDSRPSMPFCLLEMAGEDLREIEIRDEGKVGGDFDERIKAYLHHPDCNMVFICVVDVDTPDNSEELITQFLMYADKAGHDKNPVLITINKWDKIENEYDNAKDYIKKNLPLLENILVNSQRELAYMKFSIGNVKSGDVGEKDTYDFNPEDSKILFEWMYETANGQPLNEDANTSILTKIKNYFFK